MDEIRVLVAGCTLPRKTTETFRNRSIDVIEPPTGDGDLEAFDGKNGDCILAADTDDGRLSAASLGEQFPTVPIVRCLEAEGGEDDLPETVADYVYRSDLEVGTDNLGYPIGFVTRIESGSQNVVAAVGDHDLIQPGASDPLETSYCRWTVEADQPLVIEDASTAEITDDRAFERYGLQCYEIERRRYERKPERQKREQRKFKEATEQAGHAVMITNDAGTIEYVNPAFESITGYSRTEAIALTRTARDLTETMLRDGDTHGPVSLTDHLEEQLEALRSRHGESVVTVEGELPDCEVWADGMLEGRRDEIFGKGEKGLESPGTGLGLYLVWTLLEDYGGEVRVDDGEGPSGSRSQGDRPDGSVFRVKLPLAS